jgi:hypothetical protein
VLEAVGRAGSCSSRTDGRMGRLVLEPVGEPARARAGRTVGPEGRVRVADPSSSVPGQLAYQPNTCGNRRSRGGFYPSCGRPSGPLGNGKYLVAVHHRAALRLRPAAPRSGSTARGEPASDGRDPLDEGSRGPVLGLESAVPSARCQRSRRACVTWRLSSARGGEYARSTLVLRRGLRKR